jgi:hypothetical protein
MFASIISCPVDAASITLTGFICKLTLLVLQVVPVLVALALLFFFWGIANWILSLSSGDEDGAKKGRERTIWGLVALFFILSIGGIIAIISNTFLFDGGPHSAGQGNLPRNQPPSGVFQNPSGAVEGAVRIDGGHSDSPDPGFFRRVWCDAGFGDCN